MEQVEDRNRELTTNELDHVSGGMVKPIKDVKRIKEHCFYDMNAPLHNYVSTGNNREVSVLGGIFGTTVEEEYVCTNCGRKIWR